MNCSIQLQSQFQQQHGIPVRIGIHSGTVVTEGDKVYGGSVNIASRIESMGISGRILVSKKVRDELKNQPDILLPPLGQFEFKNVDEPIEVFALANEGFAVPKKEEIEGKFKNDHRKYPKWLYPASIASILLIVFLSFAWWNSAINKSFNLESDLAIGPSSSLLSKSDREKKVAVMVFENRTGSEKLEDFGSMISDWLTRGLMETGEANIISMSRISEDVALTGVGSKPNPQLAYRTGVDIMIQGNYYLQEELIIIHGNVVNVRSGQVIHALPQIDGPRKDMFKLLNRLTEEVLS
jgi:TolB-like protein